MEEAQHESGQPNGDIRVELRLLILDDDAVEHGDIEADKYGKRGGYSEAIGHVLLSNLLGLLEVVTVLDLLLHTVGVTQEADYLVAVGVAGDLLHYVVA